MMEIRKSKGTDLAAMLAVINDSAQAYRGVIPADRWHEPYMPNDELLREIADGVMFWVAEDEGRLLGVMGIQDKGAVTLVRHAYVAPTTQRTGVGTKLLRHVEGLTDKPILIGTWADASWAIDFYRRNGFTVVSHSEKERLLRAYWSIPERQIETSVVLADSRWPLDVKASYDSAANAYAEHLFTELTQKPLDRQLLDRFAEAVRGRGLVADLGCGPGHIAKYLHERSVNILGIDLSPEMVRCASRLCPGIEFQTGDMTSLDLPSASLAGIVAFYSIVHFEKPELDTVFRECRRVLVHGGLMLLAFHIGDQVVHVDDLWGQPVDLDFRFHRPSDVIGALHAADLIVAESVEREPYESAEYPSRRCYFLATAV